MTDATLNRFVATGTTAERTAFTPSPATPASGPDQGYTWYDTDLEAIFAYDFTVPGWVEIGGGLAATSTTDVLTGTETGEAVTPDALAALWEKGSDIASAGTISVGEGGFFHVTGTTTITDIDFGTTAAGRTVFLVFDGALTLTHDATTLILPTGANITTEAGDVGVFVSEGGDNVRCLLYQRKDGEALVGGAGGGDTGEEALTVPVNGDFSWVNQGSATVTVNAGGGVTIQAPAAASGGVRMRTKSIGIGSPWTITAKMRFSTFESNWQEAGLILRENATGKLIKFGVQSAKSVFIYDYTNATTYGTSRLVSTICGYWVPEWYQVHYDGTNLLFRVSCDGNVWDQILSLAVTASFTTAPDEVGWGVQDRTNTYSVSCCLKSLTIA